MCASFKRLKSYEYAAARIKSNNYVGYNQLGKLINLDRNNCRKLCGYVDVIIIHNYVSTCI